jgi:beta-lactamase regulating signal transducer with metallopeptidase domain
MAFRLSITQFSFLPPKLESMTMKYYLLTIAYYVLLHIGVAFASYLLLVWNLSGGLGAYMWDRLHYNAWLLCMPILVGITVFFAYVFVADVVMVKGLLYTNPE